ncbi:MAG: hypothetical protein FH762_02300 [Firmicutes bacterium]|nr:hypothetical protein [Bacillota bacterium]
MRFKTTILLTIMIVFLLIGNGQAAEINLLSFDSIHYIVSGDFSDVEFLKMSLDNYLDDINTVAYKLVYDGDDFNLEGNWRIKFLKEKKYNLGLDFSFPLELDGMKLGKGIGLSANSYYLNQNKLYLDIDYFFDRADRWVYEGGVIIPLSTVIDLTLGVGNSYWETDNNCLNIGLKVAL